MSTRQVEILDPIKVDPEHYKIDFENDRVRVLRINYGPKEMSVTHSHPAALAIFLNDCKARFTLEGGRVEERQGKAGETLWMEAETHLPENLSDKRFELILVELK
jgi:quercetin dioxygenase-like cupin family protein